MSYGNYRYEPKGPRLEPGDYRVEIVNVEESVSRRSGLKMIVISVRPNNSGVTIKQYIVDNEWFDQNMSEFFDSFGITPGDFNFPTWIGATGAAKLKPDRDKPQFMRVAYFIDRASAAKLPPWVGRAPERQEVSELGSTEPEDDDELPF